MSNPKYTHSERTIYIEHQALVLCSTDAEASHLTKMLNLYEERNHALHVRIAELEKFRDEDRVTLIRQRQAIRGALAEVSQTILAHQDNGEGNYEYLLTAERILQHAAEAARGGDKQQAAHDAALYRRVVDKLREIESRERSTWQNPGQYEYGHADALHEMAEGIETWIAEAAQGGEGTCAG